MKDIKELGISPTPWHTMLGLISSYPTESLSVVNNYYTIAKGLLVADARIIASAPALYECLCEAVKDKCYLCPDAEPNEDRCLNEVDCPIKRWRAALAKAAGESEVKND